MVRGMESKMTCKNFVPITLLAGYDNDITDEEQGKKLGQSR